MPNLNRVMLIGHITRDPELRHLPSNIPVCNFGIAINRRWNKDGQKQEEVTFIDLESYGKLAEILDKYVKKGDPLYVSGRLRLSHWEDRSGVKRSKLSVVIEDFQFLGGSQNNQGNQGNQGDHPGQDAIIPGMSESRRPPVDRNAAIEDDDFM